MWQKLIESNDLISFERKTKQMIVRIEARMRENKEWNIFVTHYNGKDISFTEEYHCKTKEELSKLMQQLQRMKVKSKKEIEHLKLQTSKKIAVDFIREFRDYTVEKWRFSIEKDANYNFILLRDSEFIDLDIIMHDKYKSREEDIMVELYKILGLQQGDLPIRRNIFYYSDRTTSLNNDARNQLFVGRIEFDFSDKE